MTSVQIVIKGAANVEDVAAVETLRDRVNALVSAASAAGVPLRVDFSPALVEFVAVAPLPAEPSPPPAAAPAEEPPAKPSAREPRRIATP